MKDIPPDKTMNCLVTCLLLNKQFKEISYICYVWTVDVCWN